MAANVVYLIRNRNEITLAHIFLSFVASLTFLYFLYGRSETLVFALP